MNRLQQALHPHRLPLLLIGYICGLVAGKHDLLVADSFLLLFVIALAVIAALLSSRNPIQPYTVIIAAIAIGVLQADTSARPPAAADHIYNQIIEPEDVIITGTLHEMPVFDGESSKILLHTTALASPDKKTIINVHGLILLRMHFRWPEEYMPGTSLAIRTKLRRPTRHMTPGTFDYPSFLAASGIWITGYIRSPALIIEIENDKPDQYSPIYIPERIRTTIGLFLDNSIENTNRNAIYRALLLGDRSKIPEHLYEQYKASGLAHLLAISGMHLSLIGAMLVTFFYLLLRQSEYLTLKLNIQKAALILCLPFLVGYTFLAGLNAPAIRACIMAAIVCLACCCDRPKSTVNLISTAALLILLFSPQSLFSASFQLSFAAILSIGFVLPLLRQILALKNNATAKTSTRQKLSNWLLSGIIVSLAATFGTAPIVIYHFHRFPVAGPIANLLVEPLVCIWALPFGFLSLVVLPVAPKLSTALLEIGGIALDFANSITAFLHSLPISSLWLPPPPHVITIVYYLAFLLLLKAITARFRFPFIYLLIFLFSFLSLISPNLLISKNPDFALKVSFIDVGQGSATLVELPSGKAILIDGGGPSYSSPSVGERIIAPFLWHKGITRLDTIIITHPDSDHYNGIPFLIEQFRPTTLWTSTLTSKEPGYQRLLARCREKGVATIQAMRGYRLQFGTTRFTCLFNGLIEGDNDHGSNDGLVLLVEHKNTSLLFPGDIEYETENELLEYTPLKPVDILLAAHHGSATSNSPVFLDALSPKAIIVSAGQSRKAIYPSPHLLSYAKEFSIPLYATHTAGSMVLEIKEKAVLSLSSDWQDTPLHRNRIKPVPMQEL